MNRCGVQAVFKHDSLVDGDEESDCGGECGEEERQDAGEARLVEHLVLRAHHYPAPDPSHLHITVAKELKKSTYHALFVAQSLLDMVHKEKRGGDGGAEESDALPLDGLALDGVAVAEMMVTLVAELLRELFAAHLHWSNPPLPP